MDLDERDPHRGQGITQANAGMGQRAGVDDDVGNAFACARLNAIEQGSRVGSWKTGEIGAAATRLLRQTTLDVLERLRTINARFARSKEIQVGAVDEQYPASPRVANGWGLFAGSLRPSHGLRGVITGRLLGGGHINIFVEDVGFCLQNHRF